jgi:Ca2+/H+ antiporter, TMEM165/GDT1 family
MLDWTHAGPSMLAAFLASLVEFVEALTIVLAVGTVRGWRGALGGTGLALLVLLAIIVVLGPTLTRIPQDVVQLAVGALLLLFGMRWLRKAILRAAGIIPLHMKPMPTRKNSRCSEVSARSPRDGIRSRSRPHSRSPCWKA